MLRHAALTAALALASLLAACAADKPEPPAPFTGGDVKLLAADEADCRKQAAAVDYNAEDSYSDSKYGAAAAMAAAVAEDNPNRPMAKATQDAAFESCMNAKGWKRPPASP